MKRFTCIFFVMLIILLSVVSQSLSAPSLNDTMLMLASYTGNVEQIESSIKQGANVNCGESEGFTPLHFAVISGKYEAVKTLISYGANVNAQTASGNTPLHFATLNGDRDIVGLLLDEKAALNVMNNLGVYPYKYALLNGNDDIIERMANNDALFACDLAIGIGKEKYIFSVETQKYLTISKQSDYECDKSVLIIEEPHYSPLGQFNLYKGLDAFFQDNLSLAGKTIFLVEGIEHNKSITMKPLIKAEPKPSDELITTVLDSFLITGYMAYEWKYQYGIPFMGIEDKEYYDLSGLLWTEEKYDLWNLSVLARNSSIADVLIKQTSVYDNPVLFVGGLHLQSIDETTYQNAIKTDDTVIEEDLLTKLKTIKNQGIEDFLREAKIGYTFIYASSNESPETEAKNIEQYRNLFQAQLANDYKEYLSSFLEVHREKDNGVTVEPSPDTAAALITLLKSENEAVEIETSKETGASEEATEEETKKEDQNKPSGKGPTVVDKGGKEKPKGLPEGEWNWSNDGRNKRGGKWINKGTKPHQEASWDNNPTGPTGKPGTPHWDVDDGKGNRIRYDENGNIVTVPEAHPV